MREAATKVDLILGLLAETRGRDRSDWLLWAEQNALVILPPPLSPLPPCRLSGPSRFAVASGPTCYCCVADLLSNIHAMYLSAWHECPDLCIPLRRRTLQSTCHHMLPSLTIQLPVLD